MRWDHMPFGQIHVSKLLGEVIGRKEPDAFLVVSGPKDQRQQAVIVAN